MKFIPKVLFIFITYLVLFMVPAAHVAADSLASIESLVDPTGRMTINDVVSTESEALFTPCGSSLRASYSSSTYWIKIYPAFFSGTADENTDEVYFVVMNTLLQHVRLYVPEGDGKAGYTVMNSGYAYGENTQDEAFIYPVFRLSSSGMKSPIYLELISPNTMDSNFLSMGSHEYGVYRQQVALFLGLLFGLFLTLLVYNLLAFIKLKNAFCLYFVIYILIVIVYQGAYTGAFQLLNRQVAALLQEHIIELGILTLVGMVLFARSFMATKKNVPGYDVGLKVLYAIYAMNFALYYFGLTAISSLITVIIAILSSLYLIVTAIACIQKKLWQAKYFLIAWLMFFVSVVLLLLRGIGLLENNIQATMTLTVFAALEFMLLTIAMTERVRLLQVDIAVNQQKLTQAEDKTNSVELAFLHAQIKPHFLFNVMTGIAALCVIDPVKARDLIIDLSLYLRYKIDFISMSRKIRFEEELEIVKAYVGIEEVRFSDALNVQYDIDDTDDIYNALLPPLVIQPLVENAIQHGIRSKDSGGTVTIRARLKQGVFHFEVEDDGVGMDPGKLASIGSSANPSPSVGVTNIDMRLRRLYGTGLEIKSEKGKGTKVAVSIPLTERNHQ